MIFNISHLTQWSSVNTPVWQLSNNGSAYRTGILPITVFHPKLYNATFIIPCGYNQPVWLHVAVVLLPRLQFRIPLKNWRPCIIPHSLFFLFQLRDFLSFLDFAKRVFSSHINLLFQLHLNLVPNGYFSLSQSEQCFRSRPHINCHLSGHTGRYIALVCFSYNYRWELSCTFAMVLSPGDVHCWLCIPHCGKLFDPPNAASAYHSCDIIQWWFDSQHCSVSTVLSSYPSIPWPLLVKTQPICRCHPGS